jgi:methyl-accepting chemotaxis protein
MAYSQKHMPGLYKINTENHKENQVPRERMMFFKAKTLELRLTMLMLVGSLLIGGSTFYGFWSLSRIIGIYDVALNEQVSNERAILIIQAGFKEQVQEWKNVLLRGYDQNNLTKYWGKFEAKEMELKELATRLLGEIRQPEAKQLLEDFIKSHSTMGQAYREGLVKFKEAGFEPAAGDKAVQGIDREPTEVLAQAAQAITQSVSDKTSALKSEGTRTITGSVFLSVLSLVAIIALSIWMVRRVVIAPTRHISACLNRFATGDFSPADIPEFDGQLGDVVKDTQKVKDHLGRIIQSVRNSATDLTIASDKFSVIIQSTQKDLDQQQSDIHQVATAMDQMTTVVSQVSGNAERAAEAAREADQATVEGTSVVEQTIQAIGGLARDVEGASDVIQKLEADVENIGKVLDVIRGIAEQTNLLALNAAIEAARAGEQGRGFAVVADEVRTLAGRTQDSTSEIQTMIEKLEQGAAQAVKVMSESRQQADTSVEQAASAGRSLATIANAVAAIAEMNQQIAVSSTEQLAVTEEIHRSITSINQLSQHTGEEANNLLLSGRDIAASAKNMESQVSQFRL